MSNTKNIIEINGTRYDAVSGSVVDGQATTAVSSTPKPVSQYVDGFRRSSQPSPTKVRTPRNPASHVAPHKQEAAKTLMRSAVKQPHITAPSRLKIQSRADLMSRVPVQVIAPKLSHTAVDPKRLKKATQVVQSPAVSRYAAPAVAVSAYSISPFLARGHSTPPITGKSRSEALEAISAAAPTSDFIPVSRQPIRTAKQPDIFEQALAHATSHEQKFDDRNLSLSTSKKQRRMTRLLTASLSLLLIAGIVAYINTPMISVRLASYRAGFSAKLPGYSPVGYSFGDLSYAPGKVTVSYADPASTDKKFAITQRTSDWDSQALLTNFVSGATKAYQTYERAGRTVYFFGNNTATWVSDGVWYTVNGNNSLSKNQLLDLAGSI